MGGISVLALFAMMGTAAVALLAVAGIALALFFAAVVVSIVFAARTKARHARGKKLGGLIAIPIVLFALSVPVLVWFTASFLVPLAHEAATSDYDDCSTAVTTHDSSLLGEHLAVVGAALPLEGPQSWESLLRISVEYGDADCARVVLDEARAQDVPLDIDAPLADYDVDGRPFDETPALLLAVGDEYSSPDMVEALLEHGADPNVTLGVSGTRPGSSGEWGIDSQATPLHLACAGVGGSWRFADAGFDDGRLLSETDEVVDLLVGHGASLGVRDGKGRTPWEVYRGLIGDMQETGSLSAAQTRDILAARARVLKP